ncbi:hypothetical protein [Psychromonas antarctica]|uniref:hypothetical protein n=1 Tax=Psychromonas antarctica TaxID=67573 RepID=UPI001EE7D3E4|nr:hypothetical protein [Psychromonas antarctica]MCG6202032.1 hypothetical protein [Psychromonas antarctica]
MEIITKQYALDKGLKRFFTGDPCYRGHIAERLVSSGKCVTCNSEIGKLYYQKHKQDRKSYYQNHKEDKQLYYQNNKEVILKKQNERRGKTTEI